MSSSPDRQLSSGLPRPDARSGDEFSGTTRRSLLSCRNDLGSRLVRLLDPNGYEDVRGSTVHDVNCLPMLGLVHSSTVSVRPPNRRYDQRAGVSRVGSSTITSGSRFHVISVNVERTPSSFPQRQRLRRESHVQLRTKSYAHVEVVRS